MSADESKAFTTRELMDNIPMNSTLHHGIYTGLLQYGFMYADLIAKYF